MAKKENQIIDYFNILKKFNRQDSSYLFIGKGLRVAVKIAKLINCTQESHFCDNCDDCLKIENFNHPDVYIIDAAELSSIKIADVRKVEDFFHLCSFQGEKKIAIINLAHKMTNAAANAFLKTLEEPPANCLTFLISQRTDLIMPTILSRCKKIYLPYKQEVDDLLQQELLDFINDGVFEATTRKQLKNFLSRLIGLMRDYLMSQYCSNSENLINKNNYEIILKLNYPPRLVQKKVEELLKIYNNAASINLNLASNLVKSLF
jgi:DNA polymerase-3 subunit delta'